MIEASKELRVFVKPTHIPTELFADETVRANVMYQELGEDGDVDRGEWLRRGNALIAFFEEALEGPHTDDELAYMWHTSGADFYVLSPDIRPMLAFFLERTREFQAQNLAGTFVALHVTGEPRQ